MRWRHSVATLFVCLFVASLAAQSPSPAAADGGAGTLPVRRVVLYKTGVGYFEHLGPVGDQQEVAIRFNSAQLNDVLKSLTAIDLGKGQITRISYNSNAPIEQRLGGLRLPLGPGATLVDLLRSLRGARLEVGPAGAAIVGRLLGVERHTRQKRGGDGHC